jgi:hypothetical protein
MKNEDLCPKDVIRGNKNIGSVVQKFIKGIYGHTDSMVIV